MRTQTPEYRDSVKCNKERPPFVLVLCILVMGLSLTVPAVSADENTRPSSKYLVHTTYTGESWTMLPTLRQSMSAVEARAFIHFGQGALRAGGQNDLFPSVVYLDKDNRILPPAQADAVLFFAQPILPEQGFTIWSASQLEHPQERLKRGPVVEIRALVRDYQLLPLFPDGTTNLPDRWDVDLSVLDYGSPLAARGRSRF